MSVSPRIHRPLWDACDQGDAKKARALLARGACPWIVVQESVLDGFFSPLSRAAWRGRADCVEALCEAERELLARGMGPLDAKARRRWTFLNPARPRQDPTPLARAAQAGRVELLPALARHCDPEIRDDRQLRALELAALAGQVDCCAFLVGVCDPLAPNSWGETALMASLRCPTPCALSVLSVLLPFGGLDLRDRHGRDALGLAAHRGRFDALRAMAGFCSEDKLLGFLADLPRMADDLSVGELEQARQAVSPRLLSLQESRELGGAALAPARSASRL